MKMNGEISASSLSTLSYESRCLLSSLLNSKKILPSDGPERLPRDWRGLASLVNISSEIASSLYDCQDKTGRILDLWIQKDDGTATVGHLLNLLQRLDRFDVHDDFLDLAKDNKLIDARRIQFLVPPINLRETRDDLITCDDVIHGTPQLYHAYVLYAKEDQEFVDELLSRMRDEGYKLCTEDSLLPGHSTQYAPVSRLISERCHRIILIYSPEFLNSPANTFYMDYAQAVGIEMKKPKIIPLMYRECLLPAHLTFYHKLYYSPPGKRAAYDFWKRLSQTLELVNLPRLTDRHSTHSSVNITELHTESISSSYTKSHNDLLPLPSIPKKSNSLNGINVGCSDDSKSMSNISHISDGSRKKTSTVRKILDSLTRKKKKRNKNDLLFEN